MRLKDAERARWSMDARLLRMQPDQYIHPPMGWIRAVRDCIGMTADQLAVRAGISRQRIAALEYAERRETITLRALRKVARDMDCDLIYAFAPRTSFEEMVHKRAKDFAVEKLADVYNLQDRQKITPEEGEKLRKQVMNHVLHRQLRRIWENPRMREARDRLIAGEAEYKATQKAARKTAKEAGSEPA